MKQKILKAYSSNERENEKKKMNDQKGKRIIM